MSDASSYIELGIIGRPKGLKGTVRVTLYNPKSESLYSAQSITVQDLAGGRHEWALDTVRSAGEDGVVLLNTPELPDRTAAENCRGWLILIDPKELPELASDEFYYHEIVGAAVLTPSGQKLGTLIEAIETNRTIFSIECVDGKELLIPVTPELVLRIDSSQKTVVVVEDLLDRFEEVL